MSDPQSPPPFAQQAVIPSARTVEGQTKESIGVQAAKFSLYSPFAVLLLGCATNAMRQGNATQQGGVTPKDMAGVAVAMAWLNIVLMVAGLLAGLFALISMRRFGRKGILSRSLAGVAINGALVGVVIAIFWPMIAARGMADQLVGTWHMTSGSTLRKGSTLDVSFHADKTFDFTVTPPAGAATHVFGTYKFTVGDQAIGIVVDRVENGDPTMAGERILLGRVVEVDATHLRLGTDKGDELYDRR
jgi:uncharacterized membrane protein YeaQ/YmgE (transglycosylase-associated protein family)